VATGDSDDQLCLRTSPRGLHLDLSVRLPGLPVVDFALMLHYATTTLETQNDVATEASLTQHVYAFSRDVTPSPSLRSTRRARRS
jgi:hypothetical protein